MFIKITFLFIQKIHQANQNQTIKLKCMFFGCMKKTRHLCHYLCLKSQNIISLTNRTTRYANDRMPIELSMVAHVRIETDVKTSKIKKKFKIKTAIQ